MKEKIINILKFIIAFSLFYFITDIGLFLFKLINIDITNLNDFNKLLFSFTSALIVFIIVILIYYKELKKDTIEFKKNLKKNIWYILKAFITFMVIKLIISFISVGLLTYFNYDPETFNSINQQTLEKFIEVGPVLMVISTSIFAPIYEELLFRTGIKKVIKNRYLFIIVSGLIFGLLHIFPLEEGISLGLGIIQSITYVAMGFGLAYIYDKTNICNSIGVHFLNNFLSVLMIINGI